MKLSERFTQMAALAKAQEEGSQLQQFMPVDGFWLDRTLDFAQAWVDNWRVKPDEEDSELETALAAIDEVYR